MNEPRTDHIETTVQQMAELHAQHAKALSGSRRRVIKTTALLAKPRLIVGLVLFVALWVGFNVFGPAFGLPAFDAPPFDYLQSLASILALITTLLILATQSREEELARQRAQLTLQLAALTERKIAKVIGLLEEQRRENPLLPDREDREADAMARPADPRHVMDRILETHDADSTAEGDLDD
jgi:uncharacterized membrane protein